MKHLNLIIFGKMPKGKEKVEVYCLRKGGYWFMSRKEINKAVKEGYKLVFSDETR